LFKRYLQRGIFKRFPQVKNAAKIKHLHGFGDFAENLNLDKFSDSEDVHEDLIPSFGLRAPSLCQFLCDGVFADVNVVCMKTSTTCLDVVIGCPDDGKGCCTT